MMLLLIAGLLGVTDTIARAVALSRTASQPHLGRVALRGPCESCGRDSHLRAVQLRDGATFVVCDA